MGLEIVIVSEVTRQTQKDKYDIAYMWDLKKSILMNLVTKHK